MTNKIVITFSEYKQYNFARFGSSLIVMKALNYGMLTNVLVIF